jgi:hypothetical protein
MCAILSYPKHIYNFTKFKVVLKYIKAQTNTGIRLHFNIQEN